MVSYGRKKNRKSLRILPSLAESISTMMDIGHELGCFLPLNFIAEAQKVLPNAYLLIIPPLISAARL